MVEAMKSQGITLVELLLVLAIVGILIGISVASYTRIRWTMKVVNHASDNRGRLNQAVADQKFKTQKRFDEEQARIKRQTDTALKQGK